MHHLLREVLRNGESDHVRGSSCVGVDPAHLSAGETAGLCPSPSTISSLWMVSTVEMDCHPSAACRGQPAHQWLTGLTEVTRGEGTDPHFATQRDPLWYHDGRQQGQHIRISMADQRCDSHRVIALILTRRGTDIGMGVDPQDRQIIAVTAANSEKGATLTEHSRPA